MSTATLATYLENLLTNRLVSLEQIGRQKVRDDQLAMLNPASDAATNAFKEANDRVNALADELKTRKAFPWTHPLLSAAAFETVQAACVQCWLGAGEPKNKNELVPAVKEFVRFQSGLFSTAIGADRPTTATATTTGSTTSGSKKKKTTTKKSRRKKKHT